MTTTTRRRGAGAAHPWRGLRFGSAESGADRPSACAHDCRMITRLCSMCRRRYAVCPQCHPHDFHCPQCTPEDSPHGENRRPHHD